MRKKKLWVMLLTLCLSVSPENITAAAEISGAEAQKAESRAGEPEDAQQAMQAEGTEASARKEEGLRPLESAAGSDKQKNPETASGSDKTQNPEAAADKAGIPASSDKTQNPETAADKAGIPAGSDKTQNPGTAADEAGIPAGSGEAQNSEAGVPAGSDKAQNPETASDETGVPVSSDKQKNPETAVDEAGSDMAQAAETTSYALPDADEDRPLLTEAANINNVLFASIARSLDATIDMEQAKEPAYTEEELMYLACIIYCEAGNQSFTGKVGVANVVMNRAKSEVFDHVTTIREAIYDCDRWGRQFSPVFVKKNGKWTTKGSTYEAALNMYKTGKYAKEWQKTQMEECMEAAQAALEGKYVLDGDYLYFNMKVSATKSKCKKNGKPWQVIGCHIFY